MHELNNSLSWCLQGGTRTKEPLGFLHPYSLNMWKCGLLSPCCISGCPSPAWAQVPVPFAVQGSAAHGLLPRALSLRAQPAGPLQLHIELPALGGFLNTQILNTHSQIISVIQNGEENIVRNIIIDSFHSKVIYSRVQQGYNPLLKCLWKLSLSKLMRNVITISRL